MRKPLIFIVAILLFACNDKRKSEFDFEKDFGMYAMMINELDFQSFYLKEQINYEISELEMGNQLDVEIKAIDSITKIYTEKIDEILAELNADVVNENDNIAENQKILAGYETGNNYFFKGDSLSEKAKSYKAVTKNYRNELIKYFDHPLYIKRVQSSLSMQETQDRYGTKTEFLTYFFKDTPLIAIIVQLKSMKRNSLEFEQQLLRKKPVANNV
jgi:hypothetical protein